MLLEGGMMLLVVLEGGGSTCRLRTRVYESIDLSKIITSAPAVLRVADYENNCTVYHSCSANRE